MPDDDVRSSGIGVIGGCKDMGVGVSGTKPRPSERAASALNF